MSSIVSPPELPAFNLSVAHRPGRVVPIGTAAELPGVVMEAARAGERIRPVGSGHGLVTPVDGGLALLTRDLDGVEIDPVARAARVGAGCRWSDVITAAAEHGLAPVCGSAPGVGVVGFLLGGGVSPIGRTFGWGSDQVRAFELVTGAGEPSR